MANNKSNSVWILTTKYNDYDQHGEYFEAVWLTKPTVKQLVEYFTQPDPKGRILGALYFADPLAALAFILHIESGGGRRDNEDYWYNLKEVKVHD